MLVLFPGVNPPCVALPDSPGKINKPKIEDRIPDDNHPGSENVGTLPLAMRATTAPGKRKTTAGSTSPGAWIMSTLKTPKATAISKATSNFVLFTC